VLRWGTQTTSIWVFTFIPFFVIISLLWYFILSFLLYHSCLQHFLSTKRSLHSSFVLK
jgi:hypothetical protein